jgi:chromosome segregation ATPase
MSDDDGNSGTLSPELRIRQLEERLDQETERLKMLYDAYEQQEKEIVGLKAEIEVLEKEVIDKEIDREGLEQLLTEKDNRVRDLELEDAKKGKRIEHLEPELEKMEEKYTREKERLSRVFEIAEELDGDLRLAVAEMKARDDWYVAHMQIFEDLNKAIKQRYDMIENAVEAERKSSHMQRALKERLDEILNAPSEDAADMVKDIADDLEDDGVLNRSNEEEE